jgi:2-dehydropantoate 2-reductase
MRFCVVGAGAVGGYFGAKLARAGQEVTFIARGAHLAAMREHGLAVRSAALGDFTVKARAEADPAAVGPVDVAIFAVKAYSNTEALPLLRAVVDAGGPSAVALTLQNGVDSTDEVAAAIGRERVLGGTTYVATALVAPGVIEQIGTHRRVVFGEAAGGTRASDRVQAIGEALRGADIEAEAVADPHIPIWEKFCYLAPFAAFTSAARLSIGPLWSDPAVRDVMIEAYREMEAIARAEGVAVAPDITQRIIGYLDALPAATRSSMLNDLINGKPTELEALAGAAVRRARARGVPAPVMSALYAVLKPHASVTR